MHNEYPLPFYVVDINGQVVMVGGTLDLPDVDGCKAQFGIAPADHYYDEASRAFVRMPEQPSASHVFDWVTKCWHDPRSIEQIRASQMGAINVAFERAAASLTAGYPPSERATWSLQQAEALAWGADPSAPTPFLDGLAEVRGLDLGEMRRKTLENVQHYIAQTQQLIGTRQILRAAVASAATAADIEAITWPTPSLGEIK